MKRKSKAEDSPKPNARKKANLQILENVWGTATYQIVQDTIFGRTTRWSNSNAATRYHIPRRKETEESHNYTPLFFSPEHICERDEKWSDLLFDFFRSGACGLISPVEDVLNLLAAKLKWSGTQWISVKFELQMTPFDGNYHFDDCARETFLIEIQPWSKKGVSGILQLAENRNQKESQDPRMLPDAFRKDSEVTISYAPNRGILFDNKGGQILHRGPQGNTLEKGKKEKGKGDYQERVILQIKRRDEERYKEWMGADSQKKIIL